MKPSLRFDLGRILTETSPEPDPFDTTALAGADYS